MRDRLNTVIEQTKDDIKSLGSDLANENSQIISLSIADSSNLLAFVLQDLHNIKKSNNYKTIDLKNLENKFSINKMSMELDIKVLKTYIAQGITLDILLQNFWLENEKSYSNHLIKLKDIQKNTDSEYQKIANTCKTSSISTLSTILSFIKPIKEINNLEKADEMAFKMNAEHLKRLKEKRAMHEVYGKRFSQLLDDARVKIDVYSRNHPKKLNSNEAETSTKGV